MLGCERARSAVKSAQSSSAVRSGGIVLCSRRGVWGGSRRTERGVCGEDGKKARVA